jgi:hypothetical protein
LGENQRGCSIRFASSKAQKEDERGAKSQVGGYRQGAVEESEGAGQDGALTWSKLAK